MRGETGDTGSGELPRIREGLASHRLVDGQSSLELTAVDGDTPTGRGLMDDSGSAKTRVVNRRRAPFDVYIGRPSPWGNPFSHQDGTLAKFKVANRAEAIARFREWFLGQPALVERARRELRGKVLGCWCKPATCHGDVIAEIVDGTEPFTITADDGQVWTRATKASAIALADNISRRGRAAVVTLTETGWVEYQVSAGEGEEITA